MYLNRYDFSKHLHSPKDAFITLNFLWYLCYPQHHIESRHLSKLKVCFDRLWFQNFMHLHLQLCHRWEVLWLNRFTFSDTWNTFSHLCLHFSLHEVNSNNRHTSNQSVCNSNVSLVLLQILDYHCPELFVSTWSSSNISPV